MKHVLLLSSALMLCAAGRPSPEHRPSYAAPPPPAAANGAIFQASNGYSPLTAGQRAGSIGDVVTIVLVERTQGQTSNASNTGREGSIGLTPPSTGPLSFFQPSDVSMGGNSEFAGAGDSAQSNRLVGEISVTVQEVFPNGTMLIAGEK